MTNKYTFDISKLSIQDYVDMNVSVNTNDISLFLKVINKTTSFNVLLLPISQLGIVCAEFGAQLREYIRSQEDTTTPDAIRILVSLFGRNEER